MTFRDAVLSLTPPSRTEKSLAKCALPAPSRGKTRKVEGLSARLKSRPRRAVVADAEARSSGSRRLLYSLRPISGPNRGVSLADDPIRLEASARAHAVSSGQWQQLLEAAEESGSLRQSALAEILGQRQLEPLELDALCRELEQQGVEVIDDERAPPPLPLAPETTTDALQLFLRDAGRHPLMTAAQEVELAKRIERSDLDAKRTM